MTKLDFNPVCRFGPHGYGKLQEEDQRATDESLLKKDRGMHPIDITKKETTKTKS